MSGWTTGCVDLFIRLLQYDVRNILQLGNEARMLRVLGILVVTRPGKATRQVDFGVHATLCAARVLEPVTSAVQVIFCRQARDNERQITANPITAVTQFLHKSDGHLLLLRRHE